MSGISFEWGTSAGPFVKKTLYIAWCMPFGSRTRQGRAGHGRAYLCVGRTQDLYIAYMQLMALRGSGRGHPGAGEADGRTNGQAAGTASVLGNQLNRDILLYVEGGRRKEGDGGLGGSRLFLTLRRGRPGRGPVEEPAKSHHREQRIDELSLTGRTGRSR